MNIWDQEYECMSRDELSQLQLERLQATLNRVYRNVSFYRKKFDTIGFEPEHLVELNDLQNCLSLAVGTSATATLMISLLCPCVRWYGSILPQAPPSLLWWAIHDKTSNTGASLWPGFLPPGESPPTMWYK